MTLQLSHIRHRYDENSVRIPVLDIEAFSAQSGEQLLIIGASASGKSTLLNILAGHLPPAMGHVWLKSHEIYRMPVDAKNRLVSKNIGYIPQQIAFVPEMTVLENVVLSMAEAGTFPSNFAQARGKAVLGQLGILELANILPRALSPAETVRAAIARAIAPMPRIILADEPAANASETENHFVLNFLREISRSYNTTLVVTTRNPTFASQFESVYYLYRGALEPLTHLKTRRLAPQQLRQNTVMLSA